MRWRILLVDDCADDAELTTIELRGAGLDFEWQRVDREAPLLQALAGFAPHLVLSDLNMPGFGGRQAFALVREHAPQARFVFLTGAVEENAGLPEADAVLLKHELQVLPGLVRRLMENS
jgi:two-component system, OmpR family, response regulator